MMRCLRSLALVAVAGVAVATSGCLQVETKYTIYPDGSGRIKTTMTVDSNMTEMMKGFAPNQGAKGGSANPLAGNEVKGLVGGQKMTIVTEGLFADINQVEAQGAKVAWKKLKNGGARLKLDVDLNKAGGPGMGGMPGIGIGGGGEEKTAAKNGAKTEALVEGEEESDEEESEEEGGNGMAQAFAAEMFKGMSIKYIVVMPGAVTKSSSDAIDGRTVTFAVNPADLAKQQKQFSFTASCGAPEESLESEFAAFKKELKAAGGKANGGGGAAPAGELKEETDEPGAQADLPAGEQGGKAPAPGAATEEDCGS
ncbi:MAG: hypothetical protein HZA54_12930 [Planctomycetes bacterium]|nr:hypothetical protein [Planctomycetota bacterium]